MGRWLNPDSIKIYARMTKQEYAMWIDKIMTVRRIDTARTTNLPVMDMADAVAAWNGKFVDVSGDPAEWAAETPAKPAPAPLRTNDRLSVYWSDMDRWFDGTYKASRMEDADGGGKQRASCVVYDPVDAWASCTASQLTCWHCLDDEEWKPLMQHA